MAEQVEGAGRRRRGALIVLATAAVLAVGGALLVGARLLQTGGGAQAPSPVLAADRPAVVYARPVCTFSNQDASAALVKGADGGASIVLGGRSYWLFGDTLYDKTSGREISQNSLAWSDSRDENGCPRLTYYTAPEGGRALPFIEKDGSLTVWPSGVMAVDDHTIDVYVTYIYGSGPYAYWIGEVGLGRLDTRTMRLDILQRRLWDKQSGFFDQVIAAQVVEVADDGLARVVLETQGSEKLLARVPPGSLQQADAYEFWDGTGWTRSPGQAVALWSRPHPTDPVEKIAVFENTANIAWNALLGKYVAIVNVGTGRIGARTADRLEGPWSDPIPWFDCSRVAGPAVPACYSPFQHPDLAGEGGRTIFITFTRLATYDTVAFELRLGVPIHEYRGPNEQAAYGTSPPGDGWSDQGVAFNASDVPLPGFVPVYRWQRGDEVAYGPQSPGDGFSAGDPLFYAAAGETAYGSVTQYRPVYEWRKGRSQLLSQLASGLEQYGYSRGAALFYAP